VELRGIEPLTSAARLHELERFFAVLRHFVTENGSFRLVNRATCDTLAIRASIFVKLQRIVVMAIGDGDDKPDLAPRVIGEGPADIVDVQLDT